MTLIHHNHNSHRATIHPTQRPLSCCGAATWLVTSPRQTKTPPSSPSYRECTAVVRRIEQAYSVWIEDLTFFPTFTRWWWLAPLACGLALGPWGPLHHVAHVAGEAHHVVQIEAVTNGPPVDRAARVSTADSWGERERNDKIIFKLALEREGERGGIDREIERGSSVATRKGQQGKNKHHCKYHPYLCLQLKSEVYIHLGWNH